MLFLIRSGTATQKEKGLVIHAWCLMPSHLHMIISSKAESLPSILRDFKKYTSKEIINTINRINESSGTNPLIQGTCRLLPENGIC